MGHTPNRLQSVCVFCGSSDTADPAYLAGAATLGRILAREGVRLVYGGGGVGLMGACARAAHEAGGEVLGVIPDFLVSRERAYDAVRTVVVASMHERKRIMFEESDGFAVLPGGIGTLEEVVELLSWRRLELHAKPIVFHDPGGFWRPLFELFRHTVEAQLTPVDFMDAYMAVEDVEAILPVLQGRKLEGPDVAPAAARLT